MRLAPDGRALRQPFCYRDERTVATKEAADKIIPPFELYQRTGAFPMRINTVYQLLADPAAGIDSRCALGHDAGVRALLAGRAARLGIHARHAHWAGDLENRRLVARCFPHSIFP